MLELIKELKPLVENFESMMLVGVTLLQGLGIHIQGKNKKALKDDLALIDIQQNNKIDELTTEVKNLKNEASHSAEYVKAVQFRESFGSKVREVGFAAVKSQDLPSELESLILEGTSKAGIFFVEIHKSGVKNLNSDKIDLIFRQGRAILRSLRSGTGNNQNITEDIKNQIKLEVAYPLLIDLKNKLELFSKGNYNGQTNLMYEKLVLKWIEDFVKKSIHVFAKNNKIKY